MSLRIRPLALTWTPCSLPHAGAALEAVLESWRGTPYESGQRFRGRGADCIGAVFGVIDDLDKLNRACYPGLPADAAMHNRESAVAAMRELIRRFQPADKVEDGLVQPGDVVVTALQGGGPGHVAIVGARKNELWHALPGSGFHQGGWGLFVQQQVVAVYRLRHRWKWSK